MRKAKTSIIVCIDETASDHRIICVSQKCTEYWPEDSVTYEGIEITVKQFIQADDYSLRIFTVKVTLSGLDMKNKKTKNNI